MVPPPLIYAAGFLIGVALEVAFPVSGLPPALAVAGGVSGFLAWLALDGAAMVRFRGAGTSPNPARPTTALVTSGPYRLTRNPMYLGMAALYIGLALALGMIWSLVVLPAVLAVIDRRVIPGEERRLEQEFGEQYVAYRGRVRRWL